MKRIAAMPKEVWVNVDGHPGYQVSNLGGVRSTDRIVVDRNQQRRFYKGRQLRATINNAGYCVIQTSARKPLLVHRLVAAAFLPLDSERSQVNHKNGIRSDNRIDNLEWCTCSENNKHAFAVLGRKPSATGRTGFDSARGKPVVCVHMASETVKVYGSARDAEKDGFLSQSITKVCLGQMKSHGGCRWMFA